MKQVVVVYGVPADTQAFERHYREVHVPLVKRMPNLEKFQASITSHATTPQAWHAIAVLSFRNQEEMDASLGSPAGVAAVQDVSNFASGGCDIYTCEFESF